MTRTILAMLLLSATSLAAQQQSSPPQRPQLPSCDTMPMVRQFDFWVGEWQVFATGTKFEAGSSSIQLINKGCTILENWTATAGGSGKSINFFDASKGKWHQTWVDAFGGVTYFTDGEYRDNTMNFADGTAVGPRGRTGRVRLRFVNVAPDTVRQIGETYSDSAGWKTSYDLTYVRRK